SDSGLIEIGGQCAADGQSVKVGGQVVGHSERPCQGGACMLCTLLPSLGNNAIELTQLNAQGQQLHANFDVFEEHPVQSTIDLEITQIEVLSSTSGRIHIRCRPGSQVSATIYGVEQLTSEDRSCPTSGVHVFNVALVAGLAGTGQRVVYVTQVSQAGVVSTVFADVDNVSAGHTCSITYGQANTDICITSAGTISGTCKAGSPVQVLVNGEVEHVVGCKENNTFTAHNVVLTKDGLNEVSIAQKTPFSTTCSAKKSISQFSQIP
ncbi:MAG: hypothetical protein AB7F86_02220, partial [Bdellovibrionales bacterium]